MVLADSGASHREELVTRLTLASILLVAAAVRLAGLHFSLWLDESASLAFARQPLSHLWGEWMLRETNPPLFYTLLKGWQAIVGTSDAVARLLPIAIGLVGVWGMFLLGRAIGGARAGLFAAALLALSAIHVDYSLQLRGYGLAHGGVMFACFAMVRFLQERRHRWLLLYLAGAAVAVYSHTTLLLFVGLANLTMVALLRRDRPALGAWLVANMALAAIAGWWIWMTFRQLAQPHNFGWITVPSLADAWRMTSDVFVPMYLRSDTLGGSGMLCAIVGGVVLFSLARPRPEVTLLAVLALGAPLLLYLVSQQTAMFLPRTLFWVTGPLIALLAAGVVSLAERRTTLLSGGVLLALSVVGLASWLPYGETEQWAASARAVDGRGGAHDIFVADDAVALALGHYLPDAGRRIVVVTDPSAEHERWAVGLFKGRHLAPAAAQRLFREQFHVVGVRRGNLDPSTILRAAGGRATPIDTGAANPQVAAWDCDVRAAAR
jgi:uncharacterized membrane protein